MTPLEQKIIDRIKADERRIEDLEFAVRQLQQNLSALRPKNSKSQAFVVPDIEDAIAFFVENASSILMAEDFWDFYRSKNWMVGKNKMTDWRAAARRWIRENATPPPKPDRSPGDVLADAQYERAQRYIQEAKSKEQVATICPDDVRQLVKGIGRSME